VGKEAAVPTNRFVPKEAVVPGSEREPPQPLAGPAHPFRRHPSGLAGYGLVGNPARAAWALVRVLRPRHWVKNAACLAGLIFSRQLFRRPAEMAALGAVAMFCAAASGVYILNDLCDRRSDRLNPRKARRPIASGALPVRLAVAGSLAAWAASGLTAWLLGPACVAVLVLYIAMNLMYSLRLKHAVLADVMVIALGFVLRVLAGVYAVGVRPTAWVVLCVFFLALLLGLAKRRAELAVLTDRAAAHRPVLAKYSLPYLDALLAMMAAMTVVCYAIYTVESPHHNLTLIVTIPPVVYGIARYLLLVMVRGGEAPEEMLTRDKGLIAAVLTWVVLCVLILYGNVRLFEGG
jgi:4-hydroxybenzoate polyprenyltransferase